MRQLRGHLAGLAIEYVSTQGPTRGLTLGQIFFTPRTGPSWIRWASKALALPYAGRLDPARRGAARVLLDVMEPPTAAELAERDLADELLCLAALTATGGNE